ncbi:hypothetical protein CBL_14541 [Carabus blaptoides fortunei]
MGLYLSQCEHSVTGCHRTGIRRDRSRYSGNEPLLNRDLRNWIHNPGYVTFCDGALVRYCVGHGTRQEDTVLTDEILPIDSGNSSRSLYTSNNIHVRVKSSHSRLFTTDIS